MGYVLGVAGMEQDKHVTFLPAYGAEMRGGTANCTVVVADEEIASPVASTPEIVVAMNYPSVLKYQGQVKSGGTIFLNSDLITEDPSRDDINVVRVPVNTLAHEMGNDKVLNMIMLGAMNASAGIVEHDSLERALDTVLEGKKQAMLDLNKKALAKGRDFILSKS